MDFSGYLTLLTGAAAVGVATILLVRRRKRKSNPLAELEHVDLTGKIAIVTGANTGIGFWTAQALAKQRAKVILACRSLERGNEACKKIIAATGNKKVEVRHLDLADFASVRRFVEDFKQSETRLDILVNNAGLFGDFKPPQAKEGQAQGTAEGETVLNVTITVNHLGPFLLTNLLTDVLCSTPHSRIVNVSSAAQNYVRGTFDFDGVEGRKPMSPFPAYAHSKLANLLFTRSLADRLKPQGVKSYCVHPGVVATEIWRNLSTFQAIFVRLFFFLSMKMPQKGAETVIYLCLADEDQLQSGKYYVNCQLAEKQTNPLASDSTLMSRLWDTSARLVGLSMETERREPGCEK